MAKGTKSNMWAVVGVWSYIIGLIVALIVSFFSVPTWAVALLVILGVIVGLLNIAESEVHMFLLGSVAFVIAAMALSGIFGALGGTFWTWFGDLMNAIVVFTAPGTLVVAFKALYQVAKND